MSYGGVGVSKQFFASQKTYISLQKDHFCLPTVVLLPSKSTPFALQLYSFCLPKVLPLHCKEALIEELRVFRY